MLPAARQQVLHCGYTTESAVNQCYRTFCFQGFSFIILTSVHMCGYMHMSDATLRDRGAECLGAGVTYVYELLPVMGAEN